MELWVSTPAVSRAELFAPGAPEGRRARLGASVLPTDVRLLIRAVNRALAAPAAAPDPSESIARACAGIAEWAREIEAWETAVAFAQAAALTSDEGRYAVLTGTCAEALGQTTRALSWYTRAVALSRRSKDWRSYGAAFLALGALAEATGDGTRARQAYLRTLRVARRVRELAPERAQAAHGLFRLAQAAGEVEAATAYAHAATVAVMKADAGAVHLALALAEHWVQHGRAGTAARLLRHLVKLDAIPAGQQLAAGILRVRADTLLQLAACAAALGESGGIEEAGRAALLHALAEDYPRIHAELRRIAAGRGVMVDGEYRAGREFGAGGSVRRAAVERRTGYAPSYTPGPGSRLSSALPSADATIGEGRFRISRCILLVSGG